MIRNRKWGLVLSGGGARGYAHIGVLKMLDSWGLKPDVIVGTSMGAIIGGMYACGVTPARIEQYLMDEFEIQKHLDRWIFHVKGGPAVKLLQTQEAKQLLLRKQAIDSGEGILEVLRQLTENKTFSQTRIPFSCNAVDLLTGSEIILNQGNVAEAIRASMSIPGIFQPVRRGEMLLVDGGVLNNAPIWAAKELGANKILSVKVIKFSWIKEEELPDNVSVLFRIYSIISHELEKSKEQDKSVLEIYANNGNHILDFDKKKELVQFGDLTARKHKWEIMKHINGFKIFRRRRK